MPSRSFVVISQTLEALSASGPVGNEGTFGIEMVSANLVPPLLRRYLPTMASAVLDKCVLQPMRELQAENELSAALEALPSLFDLP